ncbi:dienelactone hydrolase family protein [Chondromyces crocatus]|uniref:DeoR family transcriptional regulator n=1 Tax=Chondromyces crocatus TaxID=52 RepID=A0A0K1EK34_CHOCO|nr:dienelactone hydrolase family protein [Chondromyces crocatus]AKT41214.1 DeoR family transcriptional regulator [Chondromyces crocatus]
MARQTEALNQAHLVSVPLSGVILEGDLVVPRDPLGIVLFAHGSGSGRHSPRNRFVARALQRVHLATLLLDLLTVEEEELDQATGHLRFDIGLLASRLMGTTDWLVRTAETSGLSIGYFGASTGGGAALAAAAERPREVQAVVSRGGRPDLAAHALPRVQAPTLLIVGSKDHPVIDMNRAAMARMRAPAQLEIVPGASHLFEEAGTLEQVARLAASWFTRFLAQKTHRVASAHR